MGCREQHQMTDSRTAKICNAILSLAAAVAFCPEFSTATAEHRTPSQYYKLQGRPGEGDTSDVNCPSPTLLPRDCLQMPLVQHRHKEHSLDTHSTGAWGDATPTFGLTVTEVTSILIAVASRVIANAPKINNLPVFSFCMVSDLQKHTSSLAVTGYQRAPWKIKRTMRFPLSCIMLRGKTPFLPWVAFKCFSFKPKTSRIHIFILFPPLFLPF